MKKQIPFLFLASLMMLLVACEPKDIDEKSNYWTTNALVRLQLKGAVKTISQNDVTTEFNRLGQVVKIIRPGMDDAIYTYNSEGVLISNGNFTFEYTKSGKYIPNFRFHINEAGLTPNLSAMIGDATRTDFTFVGDSLWMISQNTNCANEVYKDTVKIYYADKYPTSFVSKYDVSSGEFMRATYQANGMFDVYTEGFFGVGYYNERISTYKKDPKYMLIEKYEVNDTTFTSTMNNVTTFTYNDKKDLVQKSESSDGSYFIIEYYDYVYDEQGNWTSRKSHNQNNSPMWENEEVETRTITYFK